MIKSEVIEKIKGFEPALRAMGAEAAFLFGSTARGTASDRSDIDILLDVATEARFTLLDLATAQRLLTDGLRTQAHLAIRADLPAEIATAVMRDAVQVF